MRAIDLSGQVALVTGASSGIGRACALALAAAGATVAVNHVGPAESAQPVLDEIAAAEGRAFAIAADVSDEAQVETMFAEIAGRAGDLHILVNNAGIQRDAAFADMTLAQWRQVLDVNLTGAFLCSRAAVKAFRRRGTRPETSQALGKIVNMSSVHDHIPWAGHVNYAASKGGLMLLTRSMAQELAWEKIRVNAVAPGAVRTGINEATWSDPAAEKDLLRLIPYGRIGVPEDVARAVLWLASEESDYVNGTTLVVDGGMTLYPSFVGNG